MQNQIKYIGCFFSRQELYEKLLQKGVPQLETAILHPHVTFQYHPQTVNFDLFGKEVTVKVTGYGNDGKNEGVSVELFSEDPVLSSMIAAIQTPHITLSVAKGCEPFDTRLLRFTPIEPFFLKGIFGGLTFDSRLLTQKE